MLNSIDDLYCFTPGDSKPCLILYFIGSSLSEVNIARILLIPEEAL